MIRFILIFIAFFCSINFSYAAVIIDNQPADNFTVGTVSNTFRGHMGQLVSFGQDYSITEISWYGTFVSDPAGNLFDIVVDTNPLELLELPGVTHDFIAANVVVTGVDTGLNFSNGRDILKFTHTINWNVTAGDYWLSVQGHGGQSGFGWAHGVTQDPGLDVVYVRDSTVAQFDIYKTHALTLKSVPVPAAVWLFGSGLIGLVGLARRKTHS